MKTKLFLAAVAVTFTFAMTSCSGNKAAGSDVATDSVSVEVVEEVATCCKADSAASCAKDAACDSTKACCKDKAGCEEKDCDKKDGCKKACDKK